MNDLLIQLASGKEVLCRVLWSQPDAMHIVAEHNGREFIAKRRHGAWCELSPQSIAATLNRINS